MSGLWVYDNFGRILRFRLFDQELGLVLGFRFPAAFSGLTIGRFRLRIPPIPVQIAWGDLASDLKTGIHNSIPSSMTPSRPSQPPEKSNDMAKCKHPRVRIVAREQDEEFVECLECGDVFEASEFKDMEIEESKQLEES